MLSREQKYRHKLYADPARHQAEKARKRSRYCARINAGLCGVCTQPAIAPGRQCATCLYRALATRHLGACRRWRELLALVERHEGRCAYTGRTLRIGDNLSFDHVVARARGGASAIENLAPCDVTVNQMKQELSVDEFLQLCREVVARRSS